MRVLPYVAAASLVLSLGMTLPVRGQATSGPFADLVERVPSSANAIVMLDVDKAISSPYGKKMQWENKIESAFMSGLTVVAPGATQSVVAVQLDLETMEPTWETAVMRLKHEPDVDSAAKMYMGTRVQVGGYDGIDLPSGAYAVKFTPNIVAAMAPASRQSVARWIREADAKKGPELSPYLTEAYHFSNDIGTPMIIAIDLEDVPSVQEVRDALSAHEALKDAKVNLDELAKAIASIRGVTLGVTLANQPFGKLKVDFRENIPLTPALATTLLLTALEKRGAMLVELEDWKPAVTGKTITLEDNLTSSGLRRLASLFNKPPSMPSKEQFAEQQSPPEQQLTPEQQMAQASQVFFKHITDLLDDLRQKPKRSRSHTTGQIGVWAKNYATKIDQLSTLHVDPALVEFAESASNALRGVHSTLATGAANARIGEVNAQPQMDTFSYSQTYGYSMWGGWMGSYGSWSVPNVKSWQHARTQARTSARLGAATDARSIMDNLDAATASIKNQMTQKYNVAF